MTNEETITTFYTAFQQKDFSTMQSLYADNAIFNDEVFIGLNAAQVRAMWEMLITKGKDLRLEFKNIKATTEGVSAEWLAAYTFSSTGKFVENRIKATFTIENGKILKHTDHFDFKLWASQALGFKGKLLGDTSFLRKKVQATAAENLAEFMKEK